jgi:glucosamine--fructose-6-phosphate aminotransferase (isomerizing)
MLILAFFLPCIKGFDHFKISHLDLFRFVEGLVTTNKRGRVILKIITMLFTGLKAFWRHLGITGLYFGRSLQSVPRGAIVFFPFEPDRLNCGITGILAFKGPSVDPGISFPMKELEDNVGAIVEYASKSLTSEGRLDKQDCPPDQTLFNEAQSLCDKLKGHAAFLNIFSEKNLGKRLSALAAGLEACIERDERILFQKKGKIPAEDYGTLACTMTRLKDIHWALKHEILANIDRAAALGCVDRFDTPPSAVRILQEMNLILNNLDRLEVRGRDSAGISLLCMLDQAVFPTFQEKMANLGLLEELEQRRRHPILVNRTVTIQDRGRQGVCLAFVYKVAAEVGRLGDNVRFLRDQITNDRLLQHIIRVPIARHSIVAHTRWASVGEISQPNCHPVDNMPGGASGIIHVCLNGDIDNYQDLRQRFERETGISIPAEISTDTKIIPLQIERHLSQGNSIEEAFRLAVGTFHGSHAIAMHSDLAPGKIFLAQKGSGQAIFVGLAEDHYVPASEIYGMVEETNRYVKLDGEKVVEGKSGPTQGQIFILDSCADGGLNGIRAMYYDGTPITFSEEHIRRTDITTRDIDRQTYPHFFLKEISESPRSVEQTIQGRVAIATKDGTPCAQVLLDDSVIPARLEAAFADRRIRKIFFIGQGTAGVAASGCAVILRDYLNHSDIRVGSFKASEFSGFMLHDRLDDTLVVAITQSGTTTDTNRAIDMARGRGAFTLAIVNRRDSDITFKVDGVLYTSTGRDIEMSVASTKAYYSQIVAGAILGLKVAQLTGSRSDGFIRDEIEHLWRLPSSMRRVLETRDEIRRSAEKYAVTKTYWAIVGSGPNKVSADEIRIKLSELCYKSISSDVVEDKKHIDLSSEPLIFVCAAGNREDVVSDIVKDTAIFKAHEAVPIVVATEGEHRFDPYAASVIHVPEVKERLAPILNTLAGHLWGYYAALAINEESEHLYRFREEIRGHIDASTDKGFDVYEIVLDKSFREKAARFYATFKDRSRQNRYATAMAIHAAADLTLLLKYLAGRLPLNDFESDFGIKGTAPNMLKTFFQCIGKIINALARPVDAIKHQAKTVTVGTSRIVEKVGGLLFEALERSGFSQGQLTTSNILVLRHLQPVVSHIKGTTIYKIAGLNILGEPTEESTIHVVSKEGSSSEIASRAESDNRLRGTKRIIVKNGNVFIGKGKRDGRSILAVPIMFTGTRIDHLVLFNVEFQKEVELQKKIEALGGKFHHIRHLVEEVSLVWKDSHLDLLEVEDLFGMSAEKVSERIISALQANGYNNQYTKIEKQP